MDPLEPAAPRGHRRALGVTQAELADHLAMSLNTIARWERGELRIGDPQRVERLLIRLENPGGVTATARDHRRKYRIDQVRVSARGRADNNLPTEFSSFVGRQSELNRLGERLTSTWCGPMIIVGGMSAASRTPPDDAIDWSPAKTMAL